MITESQHPFLTGIKQELMYKENSTKIKLTTRVTVNFQSESRSLPCRLYFGSDDDCNGGRWAV